MTVIKKQTTTNKTHKWGGQPKHSPYDIDNVALEPKRGALIVKILVVLQLWGNSPTITLYHYFNCYCGFVKFLFISFGLNWSLKPKRVQIRSFYSEGFRLPTSLFSFHCTIKLRKIGHFDADSCTARLTFVEWEVTTTLICHCATWNTQSELYFLHDPIMTQRDSMKTRRVVQRSRDVNAEMTGGFCQVSKS